MNHHFISFLLWGVHEENQRCNFQNIIYYKAHLSIMSSVTTVSLRCPSAGRIEFQVCIFLRQENCHSATATWKWWCQCVPKHRFISLLTVFHWKKSPLTICENFLQHIIREASTWLALVFSSNLFLVLSTPSHTALLCPCGYILPYGSIYCSENALWRENWEH